MANGGHLKMRILNYYCSREEYECKSIMCGRQEAACYSIEYILANNNKTFPITNNSLTTMARQEKNN